MCGDLSIDIFKKIILILFLGLFLSIDVCYGLIVLSNLIILI